MAEDLVVLREILQRELETINAYEKMIDRVSDPALKQIIEHVTDEEREHVAEMYQLIMARDEKQQARSLRSEQQLRDMHLTGALRLLRRASPPAPPPLLRLALRPRCLSRALPVLPPPRIRSRRRRRSFPMARGRWAGSSGPARRRPAARALAPRRAARRSRLYFTVTRRPTD